MLSHITANLQGLLNSKNDRQPRVSEVIIMTHYVPSSSPKVVSLEAIAPIIAASKHSAFDASIKFCLCRSSFATCSPAISAEHLLQVSYFLAVSNSPYEAASTIEHESISASCSFAVKYDNPTVLICFRLIERYAQILLAAGLQPSCRRINCLHGNLVCFRQLKCDFHENLHLQLKSTIKHLQLKSILRKSSI